MLIQIKGEIIIKKERKPSRYWVKPGRSNRWWTNILNNKATLEEWRENFRMSEASFYKLCEELRPYLTKQTTKLRKPVSVETQVAATLYYLADEGRMRKVSNSFGLGKATVSKAICRVTSVISEKLGAKYIVLPKTKQEVKIDTGCEINNNEAGGKRIRNIFVKYFE